MSKIMDNTSEEGVVADCTSKTILAMDHSAPDDSIACNEPQTPRDLMLTKLAHTDAHFKHQQRDEPDLTESEKVQLAGELLDQKPAIFLARFGHYLTMEDLPYFDSMKDDYVIDFHLKEIKQHLDSMKDKQIVRNRRYEAMQKMVGEGSSYFSDEEMKARDPLLYEQMVGKYLTEEEVRAQVDKTDCRMSNILLNHVQTLHNNTLYHYQVEKENDQMEESESDDEDDDDGKEDDEKETEMDADSEVAAALPPRERALLREEFLATMKTRFLDGTDKHYFDYKEVDRNAAYDSVDLRTQDEQERYFDDEEPAAAEDDVTVDDGEMVKKDSAAVAKQLSEQCNIKGAGD